MQAAEGVGRHEGLVHRQVPGPVGRPLQGAQVSRALVKQGILAIEGVAVVIGDGVLQRAPGETQLLGQVAYGVGLGQLREIILLRRQVTVAIGNQPGAALLVIGDGIAEHPVIGILGHESLRRCVDHDTGKHRLGRIQGHDGEALVHAQGGGARPDTDIDTHTLVADIAPGHRTLVELGSVQAHHLPVVNKTAAGQHHPAARANVLALPVHADLHSQYPAIARHHQAAGLDSGEHGNTQRPDPRQQGLHQGPAAGHTGAQRHVSARCRRGQFPRRPGALRAGEIQGFAIQGHRHGGGEFFTVAHPLLYQPIEMRGALFAVQLDLLQRRLRAAHAGDESGHGLDGIPHPQGALQGRTPAGVHHPRGHGRGAAETRQGLDQQHRGAGLAGLDGGAGAGRTRTHHQHIGGHIPGARLRTGLRPHGTGQPGGRCDAQPRQQLAPFQAGVVSG